VSYKYPTAALHSIFGLSL